MQVVLAVEDDDRGLASASGVGPSGNQRAKPGWPSAGTSMPPRRVEVQPGTGSASAVTAAMTVPARSRALVCSWSSRYRSKQTSPASGAKRGQYPRGHRVGVDGDRQRGHALGRGVAAQLAGDVGGEQIDLPGQAQHRLLRTR